MQIRRQKAQIQNKFLFMAEMSTIFIITEENFLYPSDKMKNKIYGEFYKIMWLLNAFVL